MTGQPQAIASKTGSPKPSYKEGKAKILHALIKKHNHISWSEIARRSMRDYAEMLEELERIAAKSKLTQKDVEQLDKKIKKGMWKHYEKYVK